MVRVRTLKSVSEVEELRPYWARWQTHPNADIDFFLLICNVRPEVIRPHVLVIYRGNVPQALLAGRLENTTVDAAIGYLRWASRRIRRLAFIQGGFLGGGNPEHSQLLVREVVRSLENGVATYALFSNVPTDSPLYGTAKSVPTISRGYVLQTAIHRRMTVPPSIDQLYRRFPGNVRSEVRRKARKLSRDFPGGVQIRTFHDSSDMDIMFRDIEKVARTTYQRGLHVGFKDTLEMRGRMALSAEKKWLRAYILYVFERPCAFWVVTLYRRVLHGDFIGYDRSLAPYSPGMFLMLKVLEGLCESNDEERVEVIDWGLGDAQYKETLSDREWKEGSVSVFPPTWRGACLNLALTAPALVDRIAKGALERASLLQRVKTLWRKRLASKQVAREDHPPQPAQKRPTGKESTREL